MTINNIIRNFLFKIRFYLNIKTNLSYTFNIYMHKYKLNYKNLYNIIRKINNNVGNFRNKYNVTKSKRNLMGNKKKTGKARIGSSSSHILTNGLLWFGFRHKPLKQWRFAHNVFNTLLVSKKHLLSITTMEMIKFVYHITSINFSNYNKIVNISFDNMINLNQINTYMSIVNNSNFINLTY